MSTSSVVGYFFFYSLLGWIGDTSWRSLSARKYVSGSFLPVPLCPIYGFGALFILFLHTFIGAALLLVQFAVYGVSMSLLEYVTGMGALKIFGRRLWKYNSRVVNLGHFTDLPHAILWGALGLILVRVHPYVGHVLR